MKKKKKKKKKRLVFKVAILYVGEGRVVVMVVFVGGCVNEVCMEVTGCGDRCGDGCVGWGWVFV